MSNPRRDAETHDLFRINPRGRVHLVRTPDYYSRAAICGRKVDGPWLWAGDASLGDACRDCLATWASDETLEVTP